MRANVTYSVVKRQFSDRNRDVLMNVHSPHKWWYTRKLKQRCSARVRRCLGSLVRVVDWCVNRLARLHDLLSDHFDSTQSMEAVDLPLTCHPCLTTFAFRSSEVRRLLLDLETYGGTDPLGMFPLFLARTAEVMAPRLSVVFRRLVRLGSSRACWR